MLEFMYSADPKLQSIYIRAVGIPLFKSVPEDFLFKADGFPAVGFLQSEIPTHSNDSCLIEGCNEAWNGGYIIASESGKIWYVNAGILHFVEDHHLFETSAPRQKIEQRARNKGAITPGEFYEHFMRKSDRPVSYR